MARNACHHHPSCHIFFIDDGPASQLVTWATSLIATADFRQALGKYSGTPQAQSLVIFRAFVHGSSILPLKH